VSAGKASSLDRNEHRVLALMLLVLHGTIWWDLDPGLQRSLMLVHLGLFLLWQPLLNRDRRLNHRGVLVVALIGGAFIAAVSLLLIGFWVLLLIAIVAGRVNVAPRQRHAYLATLVLLVLELLIGCVPRMFSLGTPTHDFMAIANLSLLAVPMLLLALPARSFTGTTTRAVDFLYGAALSVLTLTLGLGALVITLAMDTPYPVALIETILGIALLLLAIAWLWAPIAGFSGLGQIWERYVQNVGTPFEHWLSQLQSSARDSATPRAFLDSALDQLMNLHWVSGLEWQLRERSGARGSRSEHRVTATSGPLRIVLFAYRPMGTTLMLHARLLVRLVSHFLLAKEREQTLAQQAHLRAIYETGARVTHDIKNLLQSLAGMTSAVSDAEAEDQERAKEMVMRQLPALSTRLQAALEKLQSPQPSAVTHVDAHAWWKHLMARNEGQQIAFSLALERHVDIPQELFDSAADNLTENAFFKRESEPGVTIRVSLDGQGDAIRLSVSDTGSPVPGELADALMQGPVDSRSGLGVGLFQVARQARLMGYALTLTDNEPGRVCFELKGTAMAAASEPAVRTG
jgi:signal transduction histidine kinase